MYQSNKLKPLTTKKPSNGHLRKSPSAIKSDVIRPEKHPVQKNPSKQQQSKYVKSTDRPKTAAKIYSYNEDIEMPDLEQDAYFQTQLVRNIKTQTGKKPQKPIPKSQVLLPKLETDSKAKQSKDIEKQMDLQISRILDEQARE